MSTSTPPEIPGLVYVQPVGSGGYADVFLYEQQMPRMNVAVKVLKGEGLTPAIRRQFADEADTMAQLADHPYIVQVFRAETSADGRPYLVMKYYPPPNMAVRARSERFTVEEVLRIGIQLASAVETAHRAGITHRDIKPANVLVSQYGAPGLTDFGIAGRGGAAAEEEADDVGVSVPWAPPEVLFGQSNGDARADVYSLAATLWQLLVGRSPFEVAGGDNSAYALMPRIRSNPVPSTGRADVPVSLERLLGQSMAKDANNRPATALGFARALQEIEQEQRFPRTAIVVLDEQGQTTLADQTPSPVGDEDDRTRVRSPQAVRSAQALPQARPAHPAYPAVSGSTSIPAARHTTVTSAHAGAAGASVPDDVAEEGTIRVDRARAGGVATAPAPGEAPTPADDTARHEISPAMLLTLVGVVVALLAGVALWAVFGRGDGDPVTPTGNKTVAGPGDDSPLDIPEVPTISVKPVIGGVAFSWSYPGAEKGDTFRFRSAATVEAVADAGTSPPLPTSTKVVEVAKGTQVCGEARVVRGGQQTNWSAPRCEKAG
ncbi:serine/threonine-protein kinase [Pedococcus bigeumensis]|uniref:non-specific serine/threonine protein kinase n=1 Tax=Pedococcus bigeumensis TaxID=433644 RepID=A0A502CTZ0_9MICO|nr:serine/threonine-protein kinase [Pedococcus bigeumensis]TPG17095.1 serine/threonine protein kinase [Pedococcus bigeumensis]